MLNQLILFINLKYYFQFISDIKYRRIVNYNQMGPKPRKNKDDFEIPNKHRIKVQKTDRKGQLRNSAIPSRPLIESQQNSDDDQFQEKLMNRGSQWWRKVNFRFFRHFAQQQIEKLHQRTSSTQLLNLKYPAKQLSSYFLEEVVTSNSLLSSPYLLKVLFRKEVKLQRIQHNQLVVFAFKHYSDIRQKSIQKPDPNIHISRFRIFPQRQLVIPNQLDNIDLEIVDIEDKEEQIIKILRFDVNFSQNEQIECEISLWQKLKQKLINQNDKRWKQMLKRREKHYLSDHREEERSFDEEILNIRKQLRMNQVLLYFKRGHGDKTEEMLQEALEIATIRQMSLKQEQRRRRVTKMEQLKYLFQTDCKICFCTESDDKNRVVYCDFCNTSFHQACYGLQQLGQGTYYCQVCQYIRSLSSTDRVDGQTRIPKKPSCQICCKLNFPMRQLRGHFYHVTCLVLFDLVQIKNYNLEFKQSLSHQHLMEMVVENEVNTGYCIYCLKEAGMKFKCSIAECENHFHPICAYLNGVFFDLQRSFRSIDAHLTCPQHYHPIRNSLNQIYLRRFFCDYNGTSKLSDVQFQINFKEEVAKRRDNIENKLKEYSMGVLKKGKLPKINKLTKQKSKAQIRQKSQGILSKKQSESLQNSGVVAEIEISTQTRKLLRLISQNAKPIQK